MLTNSKKINIPIDQMFSTPKEARAAGHFQYFTGKECSHGHLSPRFVPNRRCIECINTQRRKKKIIVKIIRKVLTEAEKRTKRKAHYQVNKEKYSDYNRSYWEKNKEKLKLKYKEYRKANKELCHEKDREKYLRNRERYIEKRKQYYYENRGK